LVFVDEGGLLFYFDVVWIVIGYILVLVIVILFLGWVVDWFGIKWLYMLVILLFMMGLVLCVMVSFIEMLISFWVLQGFGGGMFMLFGMMIMIWVVGFVWMGWLMVILGVLMLLGFIFGFILGGWLIDYFSWYWIFLINVLIGVVVLVYVLFVLVKDFL